MKLDSKYFDMIRIRPSRSPEKREAVRERCQWKGCLCLGEHRAPKGRGQEGQYFVFCSDHVRQYNSSYNYFEGMGDADVEAFQKDAVTGHRPTWKVGANAWSHGTREGRPEAANQRFSDESRARAQRFAGWRTNAKEEPAERPGRKLRPIEARSMATLGLEAGAAREEIKARFKELVKRHHPDSNGGDRAAEEKLREIIQAYNYLKQAGLV
jgi:curved DNA-binding protein CbpA